MANSGTSTPKIVDLAERLLSDIRKRKLQPGDRYLSTTDAARMMGVGSGLANRALQLLERREIITRQQRRGAFVSKLPNAIPKQPLRRVHFLVHQNYLESEGIGNDMVLLGMQDELPGVHVQISFLPEEEPEAFVADLINQSLSAKAKDGFILVRAPYEVHQLVSDCGIPALVYGGLYPGIPRLSRLDRDMTAVGYQLTDYLLKRGHKRIAFLSRQRSMPGDHDTLDAIRRRLSKDKLHADSITERFLPPSSSVIQAAVAQLLKSAPKPTGFICRTLRMADAARAVLKRMKLGLGSEVDIVVCDYYLSALQKPMYVYPRPLYSLEEQGHHMARILAALARGEQTQNQVIPVNLDTTAVHKSTK